MSFSETDRTTDPDCHDNPQGYTLATGAPKPPTREELEALLLFVEVEEACRIKWGWGKREHRALGEQGFQGNALVELHSEGIDALNYLQVLMDRGGYDHECLEKLRDSALSIVRGARLLAQNGG
jgi:hypothetical protein